MQAHKKKNPQVRAKGLEGLGLELPWATHLKKKTFTSS
jgi:hypothetical protein